MPRNGKMTEAELQEAIRRCAIEQSWFYYHPFDSRRSTPGFPDTELVRGLFVCKWELKNDTAKPTIEQVAWLDAWAEFADSVSMMRSVYFAEIKHPSVDYSALPRIHVALIRPADLDAAYWLLMGQKPSVEHPWPRQWESTAKRVAA